VRGLSLSRNFGHQIAISAGIDHARGRGVLMMDADLQHPPALLHEMIRRHEQGFEVVYTVRREADHVPRWKRASSRWFYRLINAISEVPIEPAAADFRLMGPKAVRAYRRLPERGRFARGLVSWLGFRPVAIEYDPGVRAAGQSKYSLAKMVRLALDGVTAFSARPLRLSLGVGFVLVALAAAYSLYAIGVWATGDTMPGWTSILISVLLIGGVQLLSLGVLGEYMGRVFTEVKARPLYLVGDDTAERGP
jgi:dolichol-phosphate mannosyltransferase